MSEIVQKDVVIKPDTGMVFGVDFGTLFSTIAYMDETGVPRAIANSSSKRLMTPSVVYVEEESARGNPEEVPEVLIGDSACRKEDAYPSWVYRYFKTRYGHKDPDVWINGKAWSPVDFTAVLLKGMVNDARQCGFNVENVVLTYPVHFSPPEIQDLERAGYQAGLNVLRMLPEPVAAALYYGLGEGDTKTVVVFDLGGTFKVTLLRISSKGYQVLGYDGCSTLGGMGWDQTITDWVIEQIVKESDVSCESLTEDPDFMSDLRHKAVYAKIDLSDCDETKVVVYSEAGRHKIPLSRAKFDELTFDLLDRTRQLTRELLDKAFAGDLPGLSGEPIAKVDAFLLVGGSTKMAQVMQMVKESFAECCSDGPLFCDVGEAVAMGAALFGGRAFLGELPLPPPKPPLPPPRGEVSTRKYALKVQSGNNTICKFNDAFAGCNRIPRHGSFAVAVSQHEAESPFSVTLSEENEQIYFGESADLSNVEWLHLFYRDSAEKDEKATTFCLLIDVREEEANVISVKVSDKETGRYVFAKAKTS